MNAYCGGITLLTSALESSLVALNSEGRQREALITVTLDNEITEAQGWKTHLGGLCREESTARSGAESLALQPRYSHGHSFSVSSYFIVKWE